MTYFEWDCAKTGQAKIAEMRYNIIRLHNCYCSPKYKEDANTFLLSLDLFGMQGDSPDDPVLFELLDLMLQIEGCEEAYKDDSEEDFYQKTCILSRRVAHAVEKYKDKQSPKQNPLLEQLQDALSYLGITFVKPRTEKVVAFPITPKPFYDAMVIHEDSDGEPSFYAEYYSEPIEVEGKFLLPYYVLANSLNANHNNAGCWKFTISNGKGYFNYTYLIGKALNLAGISCMQMAECLKDFSTYVHEIMPEDLLCVRRFILMSENDNGLGVSMNFAANLTGNASYEADLPTEELQRLLDLQNKFEKDPNLPITIEDEESLARLYDCQIVNLRKEKSADKIKIHRHFTNIVQKISKEN